MDTLSHTIGQAIKEKRIAARLSRAELGELSGTSGEYIYKVEAGIKNPTIAQVEKIVKALGKSAIFKIK